MNNQLDFFPKTTEEECLTEIESFRKHLDKMRKSLYARDSQLRKQVDEYRHEIETLKTAMITNQIQPANLF